MFRAPWESEVYARASFSDSDDPDEADNPFCKNVAFKRTKARQLAAAKRRARQQAMLDSAVSPGPPRPRTSGGRANRLPGLDQNNGPRSPRRRQRGGFKQLQQETTNAAQETDGRLEDGNQQEPTNAAQETDREVEDGNQDPDSHAHDPCDEDTIAKSEAVRQATGVPLRELNKAAQRRIQKYIEAESPLLRKKIEDSVSRPTDLIAYHAARRESKRRDRRRKHNRRSLKAALRATMASARMQKRMEATVKAAAVATKLVQQQKEPTKQKPLRYNSGGIQAAVNTLRVRCNNRAKLPTVKDALGIDPDDPMYVVDLDAPIGKSNYNAWIPNGDDDDRPEFSDSDMSDNDINGWRQDEDEDEKAARKAAEQERQQILAEERAARRARKQRAPQFVQPVWKPNRSVNHHYGLAMHVKPHQNNYYAPPSGTRAKKYPYYG